MQSKDRDIKKKIYGEKKQERIKIAGKGHRRKNFPFLRKRFNPIGYTCDDD